MSKSTGKHSRHVQPEQLEHVWDHLLSRHPESIREAFESLDPSTQKVVLDHLKHMSTDSGWQPEQRESAQVALRVLDARARQDN